MSTIKVPGPLLRICTSSELLVPAFSGLNVCKSALTNVCQITYCQFFPSLRCFYIPCVTRGAVACPFVASMPNETHPWYALQVASHCERSVSAGLGLRGYDSFSPVFRTRRRWSDRYRDVDLPIFPGYVFCRLDVSRRLPVLLMPGVVRIVGSGRTPIPVDEAEIASLQTVVRSGLMMKPWPFLRIGQMVTLEEGPLRNVTGILTAVDGSEQLVVSISLLQRSLAVAVPRRSVRPVDKPKFVVARA